MKAAFTTALAALVGAALAGTASAETIKIGVISSYSGFLAQPADELDRGFSLYVKEHTKDLPPGIDIQIIKRDDTSDSPETGKRLAQELITREHVRFLTGVVSSPVAAAIAPLSAEAKIPLVLMNAAGVAIPRISPYVVRTSFTQWQIAYPLGKWAADQGWKKGYTAVSDYIPGHDAEEAFTKSFVGAGGTIVNAVRFPFSSPDFLPFVQRIRDAKPDVVFLWVPGGAQATAMMKAVKDLKLREEGINVVSTQDLVPDEELPNMGDIPIGLVTAGNYSTAAVRPANQAFLAAWHREYGDKVSADYMSIGAWDGMAAIFDVIRQTKGKFTSDEAMKILTNWKTDDSPRGPFAIDPATRDAVENVYIRRTEMKDGKLENVEFATIPMVKDPWKELNPPK